MDNLVTNKLVLQVYGIRMSDLLLGIYYKYKASVLHVVYNKYMYM